MYRVLFVDDEVHSCKIMENLILWDEFGIEIVPSASSAQEAIDYINRYHPDLVFTDIEMPQMDGIELIRRMRNITHFVVMSGYDNFSYVRTSMKLGALNYLLKPVSKEELTETVIECLEVLGNKSDRHSTSEETLRSLQDYTLCRLIRGQISLNEFREKSKILRLNLRFPKTVCVVFTLLNQDIPIRLQERMHQIVQREILSNTPMYHLEDNSGNVVVLLTFDSYTPDKNNIYNMIDRCVAQLRKESGLERTYASIGVFVSTPTELSNSYSSALNLFRYHLLNPELSVFHTDLKIVKSPSVQYQSPNSLIIASWLLDENIEKVKKYIDGALCIGAKTDSTTYCGQVIETASNILASADLLNLPVATIRTIENNFWEKAEDSTLCKKDLLYELVDNLLRERCALQQQYSSKVRYLIQQIHDRYSDHNFSLKCLADEMCVNSAYLGRQFKSETGVFFSDYVNKYRIQKAQELLLLTDIPASEIGARVGYTTTNYFYGIFKKYIGVNTSVYRASAKNKTSP